MLIRQTKIDPFDPEVVAQKLCVPRDTILKLRRMLNHNQSWEEHQEIFPLDMGVVRNPAEFSARKPSVEIGPGEKSWREWQKLKAWAPIYNQMRDILYFGLAGRFRPVGMKEYKKGRAINFEGDQADVFPGEAQLVSEIHLDQKHGQPSECAFKDKWISPDAFLLVVRDIGPFTVFPKDFESLPLDKATSEPMKIGPASMSKPQSEELINLARATGRLVTAQALHITGFTNRSLHAGRPVSPDSPGPIRQTSALAFGSF